MAVIIMDKALSKSAASTTCPRPVRRRASSAASTPTAACRPVVWSITVVPAMVGGPSAAPVISIMPLAAWAMASKVGRSA